MHLKFKFDVKERIDGQPVMRLPIGWGASQGPRLRSLSTQYLNGEAAMTDKK